MILDPLSNNIPVIVVFCREKHTRWYARSLPRCRLNKRCSCTQVSFLDMMPGVNTVLCCRIKLSCIWNKTWWRMAFNFLFQMLWNLIHGETDPWSVFLSMNGCILINGYRWIQLLSGIDVSLSVFCVCLSLIIVFIHEILIWKYSSMCKSLSYWEWVGGFVNNYLNT